MADRRREFVCILEFWRAFANAKPPINFDVWWLFLHQTWVEHHYNQKKKQTAKEKVDETYEFFTNGVFRDVEDYKRFPINTVFGPDWRSNINAFNEFVSGPNNYRDFRFQPYRYSSTSRFHCRS